MTGAGDDELCRELVAASRSGTVVEGPRTIPAATLRRALLQPPGPDDHPTGQLHLQGVTVEGDVDLRGSTLGVQLTLIECEVRGGLNLLEATLPGLQLDRTTVSWVDAANAVIALEVWLKESSFPAGIDFTDARVGGSMHLDGSVFGPDHRVDAISVVPRGCPVRMRRLAIGGMLSAPRIDCLGTFDLASSRVGGDLELDSARLVAPGPDGPFPGTALNAPELRVDGSLSADRRHERARRSIVHAEVSARHVGSSRTRDDQLDVTGRLYLPGVVIGGMVDLSAGRLTAVPPADAERQGTGPSSNAEYDPLAVVVLDRAEVRGNVELDAGFTAEGGVRLSGAEIGGDLRFDRALIGRAGERFAVVADGVTVRGHLTAAEVRAHGSVALPGARVSRSVRFVRAEIVSADGLAVDASTMSCSDLHLSGLDAVGGVRFADARIEGDVDLSGARVRGPVGVDGGAARIGGDLWFDGARIDGLLRLRRAEVNRSVGLKDVELGPGSLVLDLAGLRTPDLVAAPGRPLRGNVDMSRAVLITFTDNGNLWTATHLDLHGLEYQVHIDLDAKPGTPNWHTQIRRFESTKILPPPSSLRADVALPTGQLSQPYLQLAAVHRATGADSVARRILFEMRKREWAQRTAAPPGPSSIGQRARRGLLWLAGYLYRVTVGYGYRLQLALYWLAGLWLAGFLIFAYAAPAEHPDPRPVVDATGRTENCVVAPQADPVAAEPGFCGRFTPALYSLDLLVPVVDLGQKSSWRYRDETMQVVGGVLQIAGWILATAAATAALGLVGRSDSDRR